MNGQMGLKVNRCAFWAVELKGWILVCMKLL